MLQNLAAQWDSSTHHVPARLAKQQQVASWCSRGGAYLFRCLHHHDKIPLENANSSPSRIHNSLTIEWALPSVNPQPWHFTNNSLGLPHAHTFSVCLFL